MIYQHLYGSLFCYLASSESISYHGKVALRRQGKKEGLRKKKKNIGKSTSLNKEMKVENKKDGLTSSGHFSRNINVKKFL